jgi:hypothetical protein
MRRRRVRPTEEEAALRAWLRQRIDRQDEDGPVVS